MAVMTRMLLEKQFSDEFFNAVFADVATAQYERVFAFSTIAKVMAEVTFGRANSVNAAFMKDRKNMAASITCFYEKLQHVEPAVCEELVRRSAVNLGEIVSLLATRAEPVAGYRLRFLDGNVLTASEHRLLELRGEATAAIPGQSLVFYDYATDLISDLVACEDGQASERRLLPEVFKKIVRGDLIMADRNLCTELMFSTTAAKGAAYLVRHHRQSRLVPESKAKDCGRCSTGRVFEREVRMRGVRCRAIIIVRDKPLEDGKRKLTLLTNLPAQESAAKLAELYLKRWTIEEAFRQLTEHLSCEVTTLGYPKAALFAFSLAVLGYNTLACIQAALRAAGDPEKAELWSNFYIAWEIKTAFDGMQIAILPEEWAVFGTISNAEFAQVLRDIAKTVDHAQYAKRPRKGKKSVPRKKVKSKHVSTAKILEKRRLRTPVETVS